MMGVGADAVRPRSHKDLLKLLARLRGGAGAGAAAAAVAAVAAGAERTPRSIDRGLRSCAI